MGQKVNPTGIRLGIVRKHNSIWYADSKNYAKNLITDLQAREYIEKRLANASLSRVIIERLAQIATATSNADLSAKVSSITVKEDKRHTLATGG